jgi:hypothetical protein
MTATLLHADVVELFYQKILNDEQLKAIPGISVEKFVDRRALASTSTPGNKRIIVSKPRCGRFEWNCGSVAGQVPEYVKIETVVKTVEENDDASEISRTIRFRLREIFFDATFYGTGWMYHTEVQDQYPSAPMKSRAYHILVYEVWTTYGRTSAPGDL